MFSPTLRQAGVSGVVGGLLWALTPLRQPVFGAGRTPDEGEMFFRGYNILLIAISVLLTLALLRLGDSRNGGSRVFTIGWWTILIGHVLLLGGSLPAVLLGDEARGVVMGGQDVGFLGAMIAALGAFLVGLSSLRRRNGDTTASWLFLLTLPLGLLTTILLTAVGTPEDYLGLPLTLLYGGAWVVLGWSWIHRHDPSSDRRSPGTAGSR